MVLRDKVKERKVTSQPQIELAGHSTLPSILSSLNTTEGTEAREERGKRWP